ncbi:MAG: hypothetical protein H7039_22355, partial [Bryobacteraceae bacterium]|nr:hypothetical protein [Bryobacteraceae bacterium]
MSATLPPTSRLVSLGLCWAIALVAQPSSPPLDPAPLYVESSIVNAASPKTGSLAPNTLATIFGQFLSRSTRAVSADDIRSGVLPTVLPGTGVRVLVGGLPAPLLYVSPNQINFVVPANLLAGATDIRVGIDSRFGPSVRVHLVDAAPALFPLNPEFVLAVHAVDGTLLSPTNPARNGEIVTIYATGLGAVNPPAASGQIVLQAAGLVRRREFRVLIGGWELPDE